MNHKILLLIEEVMCAQRKKHLIKHLFGVTSS